MKRVALALTALILGTAGCAARTVPALAVIDSASPRDSVGTRAGVAVDRSREAMQQMTMTLRVNEVSSPGSGEEEGDAANVELGGQTEKGESRMSATVKRKDGKAWIEGVPDGPVGWQWDALLRGTQIILRHRGVEAPLDELMAYSGDAFNLCHGSRWQGVAYLCMPTDPVANLARAYGFEYACLHHGYGVEKMDNLDVAGRRALTAELLERVWAEIDAGRPALVGGCNDGSCGDWTVVVGYDRDSPAMCHIGLGAAYRWIGVRGFPSSPVYGDDRSGGVDGHWNGRFRGAIRCNFVGGWQNNPAYLLGEKTHRPADRVNAREALQRAAALFRADSHHIGWWGGVDYCFGEQAYEEWERELRELDFPADLQQELPEGAYDWYEMGNMDTQIDQIVRGRHAAASFCLQAAGFFPEAERHLRFAARHYRLEVNIAREAFEPFIPAYDGDDESRIAWLSDEASREVGAVAIARMLAEERAAIDSIEEALTAIE